MKGGRWVTVLKIGTATKQPIPIKNIIFCSKGVVLISLSSAIITGPTTSLPRRVMCRKISGTTRQASDGRKTPLMMAREVI
ncbi:MAG: hypothetical protein ACD_75C01870G0002 [uncultured bacterium]|nr:MAG: hypothetical protein ACD_75C01870G0002 [uncultured bacterium]